MFGDTLKLMRAMMAIMQAHCPERSEKLFVVNAPRWFASMWRVVSPLLDPNTRKKIDILGKDFHAALFEWVAPDQVPAEMGGQDPTPFGQSPEEVAMRAHVDAVASGLFLHLGRVLVVTDAPEVRSRVRLPGGVQHPLCDANRVLARSTGNVVHLVVFDKFSVHGLMFLFCEHCIARLDAVPVASQQHRRRIIIIIICISKAKRL